MFIWSLAQSSSTRVYCWRVLLWIIKMNDKFITFTKIIIFLQLRRKKARKLMTITSWNMQYSNSTKFNKNCLKKARAWCEVNVTMLFKNFYKILWIEDLKIKAVKINKIVFISILNRAARKCLSHLFITTKLAKQLQLAFLIFNEIINFDCIISFFSRFVIYFESAHLTSCRAFTQALLKYLIID